MNEALASSCVLKLSTGFTVMAKEKQLPSIITLNVGGHIFTTRLSTLVSEDNSMLSSMFSGRFDIEVDDEGRYFIDRDGKYFEHVLNYLRDNSITPPSSVAIQVYQEARYYRIERLMAQLECYPSVMAITKLNDQKLKLGDNYDHWKQLILQAAYEKYSDVLSLSIGQEYVITSVRYISKQDYISATSPCNVYSKYGLSDNHHHQHNFYCSDEAGSSLSYFIGSKLPNMDIIIPDNEIKDICLFTSLVEKDLRSDGFCVSGRSSHTWRCSQCDIVGYLHQIAFTWKFTQKQ